ncbi:ABC transporter ATP-binding protein [uncultured Oscillibacter sp.]|uniref:ABC transporter ATP-binding protein n=1 Tax=uncultured Oscillibacter sp. TaxID=876091 RepID=UPI0025E3C13A|nr:ABC transporter ATP-binding protein [uncultured Oscillibacter sp.]
MKKETAVRPPADTARSDKTAIRRLLRLLGRQRQRLAVVVAATLLSSAAFAAIPLVVGRAMDALVTVIQSGAGAALPGLLAEALGTPVLLLILASAASALFSYVQQYVAASVGENLALSLRRDVSEKLNRLPLRYFDAHQPGEIMSRVTNDVEKISAVIQSGLLQLLSAVCTILFTLGAMVYLSLPLTGVTLAAVVGCAAVTGRLADWSERCNARNMAAMGAVGAKVEEVFTGNRVVKIFSRQRAVMAELSALNREQFEANRDAQFAEYAVYPAIRLVNQIGFVALAVVGGASALGGAMTLGAVQAFLQYFNQISEPITNLSYVLTETRAAVAGAKRVFAVLDEMAEREETRPAAPALTRGQVRFEHVRFGYTPERVLIQDLSLTVKPNEMVAIVGPTGGGKTTLINLLMRFYELDGGVISIDGVDISTIPRAKLRQTIGMVLQDTWLFAGTVAENIAYGKPDATREEIVAAALAARCDHFIRTLPQGYDTVISGDAAILSQGQMQLLTIARAMLTNPAILILDEATSSVDTRTEVEIQKAMAQLMQDKTSFVIAHRLSTIRNADMILVVKDGDIVERGNHEALLARNGFYASLYFSQFENAG